MTAPRAFANSFIRIKRVFLTSAVGGSLLLGFLGAWTPIAYGQTLSLVWSDEFNSAVNSNVDTTKWKFDTGAGGWGNNELQTYTSKTNNAYVAGGFLHIRAQRENTSPVTISSARLKTQGLFATQYGRIEWHARLPAGAGMWPALWMMGTNINTQPWPKCGEIDVVENDGANIFFDQGSIHSGGNLGDSTGIFNFTGGDSVTNFHVYDLDWVSNSIKWSVDNVLYETQTNWTTSASGKSYPFPFNQGFFLLMNLATGGNFVNNPSTNAVLASLPNEFLIDYVRVYQFVPIVNPLIVAISPVTGCATGGTPITVSGVHFKNGCTISMNGVNATGVTFVNSNTLTGVTGPNPPGTYTVIVKTPGLPPTSLTNGFTYASPPLFEGPDSVTPAIEGATLSWSDASGTDPFTYGVYEATNSGGEVSPLLTTNALSVFIPLYPGSNSPITYFFKVNAVDGCAASDTNQVELAAQPLLDPTKSQVGDGIPNGWKQQYGLNPFDPTVAAADPDGDGVSNLQEFLLGTSPIDSSSPFRVAGITLQGPDALITWLSVGGMTNAVESTPDPGGSWSNISGSIVITGTALTTTNYLDAGAATNTPANYYRVRLVP
ncbi:MAG TPA: family 16 glycosylhydrolase [Verrucomicrobiae bacterium]|nr:family 16 glycosylhydrolase [Verrucomicrobiae bacterium]